MQRPVAVVRCGAIMLLVQPLSILAEVIAAAWVTVPYSFAANTISDLAATSCTLVSYPFGPVAVCSPLHALMNASFVILGSLCGAGVIGLRRWLLPGPATTTALVLALVAAASSIATGAVPEDQDLALHAIVSLPVFVAQPALLLTLAIALRHRHRHLARTGIATGTFCAAACLATITGVEGAHLGGAIERLALWPGYLWMFFLALTALRTTASGPATQR